MTSFSVNNYCFQHLPKDFLAGFICEMQVIDYYRQKGVVAKLPAEKPPKEVTVEVEKVLSE